jgi:CHAT domain-containing protein/tetratricopeptide (TPR) repeat protein
MKAAGAILMVIMLSAGAYADTRAQPDGWSEFTQRVSSLYAQGEYDRAVAEAKRALQAAEEKYGAEHSNVGLYLNYLGELHRTLGQGDLAEPMYLRALAIAEKAHGLESADVAGILGNLARLYNDQGRYTQAEPLLRRSLAIDEKFLGPEHPYVAISLNNLALVLRSLGQFAQAEPLARRALAIKEQHVGPEHPDVAVFLLGLGALLSDQCRYAQAEELYERSRAILEKNLGPEHPDVANSLSGLAALYSAQGRYAQMEPLLQRALAIQQKFVGPEHSNVANILANLAESYVSQGRYAQAEPLHQRALALFEKTLGPEHPSVAYSLSYLASLHADLAEYATAETLFQRALAIRERAFGQEHPEVAKSLNDLASLYLDQGRFAEAEPFFRRALAILEKTLGPGHRHVGVSLRNLASWHMSQGRFAEAEALYRRSQAISEATLGPEHPDFAYSLGAWAASLGRQGRYAQAETLCGRALAILEKTFGPEHPNVAAVLHSLAQLHRAQGHFGHAGLLLWRALAARENALGPEHPHVADSLNDLAVVFQEQGQYARVESLHQRALTIRVKALGPEHPEVAVSLHNLAGLYGIQGQFAKAESLFQRSLVIKEKSLGPEHNDLATSLIGLAGLYRDQGLYSQAEPLYRRALAIQEQALGSEHPDAAVILNNLAGLYKEQGQNAKAEAMFERALAIRQRALGPEHPDVADDLVNLAHLDFIRGDSSDSVELFDRAARVFETARLVVGSGLERATFRDSPYAWLAASNLMSGNLAEAWPAAERNLGRVLADLLLRSAGRPLTSLEMAREDSLKRLLVELENRLAALNRPAPGSGVSVEEQQSVRLRYLDAQAALRRFQHELSDKYPVAEGQAFPLERLQAALLGKSALVGWLDVAVRPDSLLSWAYVVTAGGPVTWVRLADDTVDDPTTPAFPLPMEGRREPRLHRLAHHRRQSLADPRSQDRFSARLAYALSAARIHPVLPLLEGVENLIVVPSGVMDYNPVESLVDEQGRYLADRFAISYVPSATIYTWLHEQEPSGKPGGKEARSLLLGDPPFTSAQQAAMTREEPLILAAMSRAVAPDTLREARAGDGRAIACLPRLPSTRSEVGAIASMSSASTVLLGSDASEQELTRLALSGELAHFGTLHLATHALADPEQPERSCLILSQVDLPDAYAAAVSGERLYDGRLTVEEILREWKLEADLVTLSACETGLGRQVSGEGMVGFAHAFLQAGARSLLVSLWKVDDKATSLLMTRFYENLWLRDLPKAAALREAKAWLREYVDDMGERPYEHPFFWSAFVLIGVRD